jgi:hypothetical protein
MENLISLIVDLLTALFSGSKKDKDAPSPPRPDPSRPRPAPGPTSWENELRRLLDSQGQSPAPPPARLPQPVAPPPTPRIVTVPRPVPVIIEAPAPMPAARVRPVLIPPPLPPGLKQPNQPLATLSESQQAYTRASQLDKSAAARIERVPGQEVQLTKVIREQASPEIAQVVSLFKNPKAARQAVIASIIFGSPRAFEEQTSANF